MCAMWRFCCLLFVYLLIVLFQLPEPVASCLSLTFKILHAVLTADVSSVPFPLLCLLGCSWCMYLTVVITQFLGIVFSFLLETVLCSPDCPPAP